MAALATRHLPPGGSTTPNHLSAALAPGTKYLAAKTKTIELLLNISGESLDKLNYYLLLSSHIPSQFRLEGIDEICLKESIPKMLPLRDSLSELEISNMKVELRNENKTLEALVANLCNLRYFRYESNWGTLVMRGTKSRGSLTSAWFDTFSQRANGLFEELTSFMTFVDVLTIYQR